MNFCPKCRKKLVVQDFCVECGADLSEYLSNDTDNRLGSFDFLAMENEAQRQLKEKKKVENFYKNSKVKGTVLVEYNGNDTDVVIPDGITEIKYNAFYNTKVKSITIPATVTKIENTSYWEEVEQINVDEKNKYFKSIDGVVYSKNGKVLVLYPHGKAGHYSMPNEVESVALFAISGRRKLTGITLSKRLTQISQSMLSGTGIQFLEIPSSITLICINAFAECGALTSITIPGSVVTIEKFAFGACRSLRNVTINEGVISIGESAFANCSSLINISLPISLREIDKDAFRSCGRLTSITIPSGVTEIKPRTFNGCGLLREVTLSEGIRCISEFAFDSSCEALRSIKIPYSMQTVHEDAFYFSPYGEPFVMYVPRGKKFGLERIYNLKLIEY